MSVLDFALLYFLQISTISTLAITSLCVHAERMGSVHQAVVIIGRVHCQDFAQNLLCHLYFYRP